MQLPSDPGVWIILIVAAACVVLLATWLGRNLIFQKKQGDFSLELRGQEAAQGRIDVAKGAELTDVEANDIAGVKQGNPLAGAAPDISVLEKGKVTRAKLGDIVGIKQTGNNPPGNQ